jgi:cell wall-associated NlpC family hydrolase
MTHHPLTQLPKAILHATDKTATGLEVVECARTYIGTPYGDYGRKKGFTMDCIGLPLTVGHELGIFHGDFDRYSPTPKQRYAMDVADGHMGDVIWTRPGWPDKPDWYADLQPVATQAGDVGLFWFSNRAEPQHFAIFGVHPLTGGPTMIHAHSRYKKCVEATMDEFWARRLVRTYRLPNVKG